ncbi:DNA polymerase/3'-5' exonuclease PolX [Aquiflexum gelatinilyticum]|uniref:Helix-hairpin-helix domain-containing protein n=1 Tax=Aquiflexum gelatinilyticum TaxID=2961943 RepID=A0A9X2T2D4_9BACT|nr:DNA polymerase/3'-5' exonuclease PolX [Aquiflexum gelatinilyticum]MCR9016746.1 helix-hairpin-helix domain-containing protein [Aquiflexum gelatinilyticum]
MELHDENSFKIRNYQAALNNIDRNDIPVIGKSVEQLQADAGMGKSIAEFVFSLATVGTHPYLEELLAKTPTGILEILEIKGLGPKKVKALWEDLNITSTHELLEACQSGQVAKAKGFGEKTQESILASLQFREANQGKWLYADIEVFVAEFIKNVKGLKGVNEIISVGDFGRKMEIIETVEFLVSTENQSETILEISSLGSLEKDRKSSSPFKWRGKMIEPEINLLIHFTKLSHFVEEKIVRTATKNHLLYPVIGEKTLIEVLRENSPLASENELFEKAGLPWIPEELREGYIEFDLAKAGKIPQLLEEKDLKGILHNHSTYSDGKHTLKQMAEYCKELGYEYLGISDHSRTAFYAGGLEIEKVQKQHQEIDQLNKELAPFRIFKGIESDILTDGSLDYPEEVLVSFDFIVSSVHSNLGMDRKKATARLLNAIVNPYTTILGHPTGRLLLRREGYPIDHKAVIDACALHNVVIEINANPWRLDLDWRWVNYAMEKGVKLSINPDAHEMEGYADMKYGVIAGRKGGLTKDMTFNAMSADAIGKYFQDRKNKIK